MSANVGASRIRIAVLIVAEISSEFSALAMFALHIGQANVCAAAARIAAAHSRPLAPFAQHHIAERDQAAYQVRAVQPGENISVPAVVIPVDVEAARDQALPQDELRG